jgi:hypothetical protein
MQHAMRMRHILICDLPRSTTLYRIIPQTARISKKKKNLLTQNLGFDFPYRFFRNISQPKKI